jgi:hypothetical protein
MKRVYLAGPINGCTDEEAKGWRDRIKAALAGEVAFDDPMDRDYRGKERGNEAEIVERDLVQVLDCDLIVANCWKPSWGTAMEIAEKTMAGGRVLVIHSSEAISPWLDYYASVVVWDEAEAIVAIRRLLGLESKGGEL